MEKIATSLPDVWILEPKVFGDHRGFFMESWSKRAFEEAGLPTLLLDGDSCDRGFGGEGQAATRVEAFLEVLEGMA